MASHMADRAAILFSLPDPGEAGLLFTPSEKLRQAHLQVALK